MDDEMRLPPEIALDPEPFDLDDLDAVVTVLAAGGAEPSVVLAYGPDEPIPGLDETGVLRVARWRPANDGEAEWAARHYRAAVEERDRIVNQSAEWQRQISEWMNRGVRRHEGSIRFFEAILEDYALRQRAETGGTRKTVDLPSATIRTRPTPARVALAEGKENDFVQWATEFMPDLVRSRPAPAVAAFKDRLEIREVVERYEYQAVLACGHEIGGVLPADLMTAVATGTMPTEMECPYCPTDPIEGQPTRQVENVEMTTVTREAVIAEIEDPEWVPSDPGQPNPYGTASGPGTVEVEPPGLVVLPLTVTAKVGR